MIRTAFKQAFEWLGYGAKTAGGYGAMVTRRPALGRETTSAANDEAAALAEEVWEQATLEYKPNTGEITASFERQKTAPLRGEAAQAFLAQLGEGRSGRLKKNQKLSGVVATVHKQGKRYALKGVVA